MRNPVYRPHWMIVLASVVVAGMSVASGKAFPAFFARAGQTLSASSVPALRGLVDSGRNADLRWPDFTAYKTEVLLQPENVVLTATRLCHPRCLWVTAAKAGRPERL
jgi:hypothetical protein